ncbi:MAG: insulinase family protein, partial [Candidatus Omnitrophica bacterium]|nr:insulinase family protein [Candidatus Omnitrophota bacterium]
KLIFSRLENRETASLGIYLRVGSRLEPKKIKGIAHFLEHMVFKGSKHYSHRKIKQEIEGRGGFLNAYTSQETTAYYANFLKKNFTKTLDILLDMVKQPLFKPGDIDKERRVILQEIKMYNDLPSARAATLLEGLLWKGHSLGQDVIGQTQSVNKIARSDLDNFRNKYYLPANMVISFCGAISRDDVLRDIKARTDKTRREVDLEISKPESLRGLHIASEKKDLEQSHLCIGLRALPWMSPQRLVLRLINIILGANMSSRLFEELREKKSLCYDISTEVRSYHDSGAFMIHLGLEASKITLALSTILRELTKLKVRQVGPGELSRAKDYLTGQMAMGLEIPQGRMEHFAQSYLNLGKINTFPELKKSIQAVSAGQIKQLAERIFNFDNLCVSCVGNLKEDTEARIRNLLS